MLMQLQESLWNKRLKVRREYLVQVAGEEHGGGGRPEDKVLCEVLDECKYFYISDDDV